MSRKLRHAAYYRCNPKVAPVYSQRTRHVFKCIVCRAAAFKIYVVYADWRFYIGGTHGFGRVEIKQEIFRAFVVAVYETAVAKRQLGIFVAVGSCLRVGGRRYHGFVYRKHRGLHFRELLVCHLNGCRNLKLYSLSVMIRGEKYFTVGRYMLICSVIIYGRHKPVCFFNQFGKITFNRSVAVILYLYLAARQIKPIAVGILNRLTVIVSQRRVL